MTRISKIRPGSFILASLIAGVLWLMAHGTSTTERGYDIPVVFQGVPDHLVITDQNADVVNIQLRGSRAVLRNLQASEMEYPVDVSGAKPGSADYKVDVSRLEIPRRASIVSRSPASIEVRYERRGRKAVKIRPDLEGEPAEGFEISQVEVEPPRVWLVGARSEVLRLSEVVTETVDVAGLAESVEREVRLSLGGGHVWMEESQPVMVRIAVEADGELAAGTQEKGG